MRDCNEKVGNMSNSFIRSVGRQFGTQQVVVIHNPETAAEGRRELEAQVHARKVLFDVDAQVYEGDRIELGDPRGGTRSVWVTKVDIFQAGNSGSSAISHIEASISDHPLAAQAPALGHVVQGDQILVSGNNVNVATRGSSIQQQQIGPVTHGYEELARTVQKVRELLEGDPDLDPDDRDAAQEASEAILGEIVKSEPDHPKLKKALALLRGVLVSSMTAAAAAATSDLMNQLVLPKITGQA